MTVRKMSNATGISLATIGDYFSGAHLPSAKSLTTILAGLGIMTPEVVDSWLDVLGRLRRRPGPRPASAPVPYRGLASYQPEDADWFFGRERLTSQMADRLAAGGGALIVVGPSGSGKSSVIRAGLVPRLRAEGRAVVLFTPGEHPLRELAAQTAAAPQEDRAVVVDQFEEVFTACTDEDERRAFIAALTTDSDLLVIGLRADLYGHALAYPALARLMQDAQVVLGPMTEPELRSAIVGPARKSNLELDDGLVDLLLRDLEPRDGAGQGAAHDAGSLPLLSHALLATWEAGTRTRLTVAQYRDSGGVQGAVARTADDAYGALTDVEKKMARRLLLRLVRVTDDGITRRRVRHSELLDGQGDDGERVLEEFIDRRLITVDTACVEIAHEALLRAWPRLRTWIEADRASLHAAQALTDAAEAWDHEGREAAALYRGNRLAAMREWIEAGHRDHLSAPAREFYDASVVRERRRSRRVRRVVAGFAIVSTLAVSASVVALRQTALAVNQRDLAISRAAAAYANDMRATDPSLAMQLSLAAYRTAPSVEARSSLLDSSAAPTATRMIGGTGTLHALAFSPDHRTLAAGGADNVVRLWDLTEPHRPALLGTPLTGAADNVTTVAYSADGRMLAVSGADTAVRLWDVGDPRQPRPVGQPLLGAKDVVNSVAISPDGSTVAAGSSDATVRLWNVADPTRPVPLAALTNASGAVNGVAFSPNGSTLATGSTDLTVRLWDVTNPADPVPLGLPLQGATAAVNAVAFSPDGKTLAAGSSDMTVRLWDVTDPRHPGVGPVLSGPASWVFAVAFSADGHLVAAASADESVRVWDVATGRLTETLPHPGPVTAVAFGADGHTLATGAADGVARVWSLPTPILSGADQSVFTVAFSTNGHTLAAASGDGTVRLWDITDVRQPVLFGPPLMAPAGQSTLDGTVTFGASGQVAAGSADGSVYVWATTDSRYPVALRPSESTGAVESVAVSPDGTIVAAGHAEGGVQLWSLTGARPMTRLPTTRGANTFSVAFSPNGRVLAAASADKSVWLWEIADPDHPTPLGPPLAGFNSYAYHVAFSPDGHTLAAGSADGTVRLWDMTVPAHPRALGTPLTGPKGIVYAVAFTPNGRSLTTANTDQTVWMWDITDREHPTATAVLTGFAKSVFSVTFHPDGHTLAAGGRDRTVRLWDTSPELVAAYVCSVAGAPITESEWRQYFADAPYDPPC